MRTHTPTHFSLGIYKTIYRRTMEVTYTHLECQPHTQHVCLIHVCAHAGSNFQDVAWHRIMRLNQLRVCVSKLCCKAWLRLWVRLLLCKQEASSLVTALANTMSAGNTICHCDACDLAKQRAQRGVVLLSPSLQVNSFEMVINSRGLKMRDKTETQEDGK